MRTALAPLLASIVVASAACGAAQEGAVRARDASPKAPAAAHARSDVRARPRLVPALGARESGSVALASVDGRAIALAADEEGRAVVTFDADTGAPIAETPLDGAPAQLLPLADGRVVVTLRDRGRVVALAPDHGAEAALDVRATVEVAAEPIALAASADGARIYVTSGWGAKLTALRAPDLAVSFEVAVPREPRAVLVDPRGDKAYVAHALGAALSVVDLETRAVTPIDLRTDGVASRWTVGPARLADQGYALARGMFRARPTSPERARLFAPGVSVDPGQGVFSSAVYGPPSGNPVLPVVHVVDEARGARVGRAARTEETDVTTRCNLPRAAVLRGPSLFVACLGVDAVVELDARGDSPMSVELRRFAVPAGPTGLAVDDARGRAVVWSAFAHRLTVLDLSPGAHGRAAVLASGEAPRRAAWIDAQLVRGRELFHTTRDPRISGDGRACASCHVDGREDGLVWSTPAGARQTPMLAGRLSGAAPFGWTGARATLEGHIRDTWRRLGGRGVFGPGDVDDLGALAAYVTSMKPPVAAAPPGDAAVTARGRQIFEDPAQGCAGCHPGGHTDGQAHDLGDDGAKRAFDTPSLHFVAGTAPYFHDGRYPTLDAVLRGSDGRMGHTSHLSEPDLRALVAYLETL